jgi:chloramphenicol-sensitive protein RarD
VGLTEATRGFWAVFVTFVLWGLFPVYWHQLREVPSAQILAHRIVWCALLVIGYLSLRQRHWLKQSLGAPRVAWLLAISGVLITVNWGLYIWAVNHEHVVDASLGYFINPLVNVMFGVLLLHERLNRSQRVAVALAVIGVSYLTWELGAPPWIALTLAVSFGCYGLIRKIAPVQSIAGLGVECAYLLLPAMGYLLWCEHAGNGALGRLDSYHSALLIGGGAVTALPLVWFAYGARRIPYSLVGIVQFVAPTLQLLTGVLLFREPFTSVQAFGFSLIWAALLIYAADAVLRTRRQASVAP